MREVFMYSSGLAVCSTAFALPYFHYLVFVVQGVESYSTALHPWKLLLAQLLLLFILCLLSALIGLSFYKRFELPGFGDPRNFTDSLPLLFALGAVMMALSYFLFDRYFFELSPVSYPKGWLYLISMPFKGAFTEEVILRLCLVTLCVGFLKNKSAGIVLASAVASLFTIKYFHFVGVPFGLNYLSITQMLLSFLANLILAYLFVTRGLIYSMALKFVFGIKYALISLVLW